MIFALAALFCFASSVSNRKFFIQTLAVISSDQFQLSTASPDDLVGVDEKNCTTWPKTAKLAIECCIVPEIFKQDIKNGCIANCSSTDPAFNSWCCSTNCIFEESGFLVDGNFSAENAKKELSAVLEKNPRTANAANGIVDRCEKQGDAWFVTTSASINPEISVSETEIAQDRGKTTCATPQLGYIMSCMHKELFSLCPEAKPEPECIEIQKFLERCPNRKQPPFRQNNQKTASKDRLGEAMKEAIRDPKEIGSIE